MDRKASVIMATEPQLAGLDVSGFKRFIQYDITSLGCSLATRASSHASVIIFFMRHEVLAVNLMQDAGVELSNQAADLLPLQYNNETGQIFTIEAVRTSCFTPVSTSSVLVINTEPMRQIYPYIDGMEMKRHSGSAVIPFFPDGM